MGNEGNGVLGKTLAENLGYWTSWTEVKYIRTSSKTSFLPCKLLWLGLALASLGPFIWQSRNLVNQYYEYKKDTVTRLVDAVGLSFPAVTMTIYNALLAGNTSVASVKRKKRDVKFDPFEFIESEMAQDDKSGEFHHREKRQVLQSSTCSPSDPSCSGSPPCVLTISFTTTTLEISSTAEPTSTTPVPTTQTPPPPCIIEVVESTTSSSTSMQPTTSGLSDCIIDVYLTTTSSSTSSSSSTTEMPTSTSTKELTTIRSTTKEPTTSTRKPSTTREETTTRKRTTTADPTTTEVRTTTRDPSTTPIEASTDGMTSTGAQTTTFEHTPTKKDTTTVRQTSTEAKTSMEAETTSEKASTTVDMTTSAHLSSTQKQASTFELTSTARMTSTRVGSSTKDSTTMAHSSTDHGYTSVASKRISTIVGHSSTIDPNAHSTSVVHSSTIDPNTLYTTHNGKSTSAGPKSTSSERNRDSTTQRLSTHAISTPEARKSSHISTLDPSLLNKTTIHSYASLRTTTDPNAKLHGSTTIDGAEKSSTVIIMTPKRDGITSTFAFISTRDPSDGKTTSGPDGSLGKSTMDLHFRRSTEDMNAGKTTLDPDAGKSTKDPNAGKTTLDSSAGRTTEDPNAGKTTNDSNSGLTTDDPNKHGTTDDFSKHRTTTDPRWWLYTTSDPRWWLYTTTDSNGNKSSSTPSYGDSSDGHVNSSTTIDSSVSVPQSSTFDSSLRPTSEDPNAHDRRSTTDPDWWKKLPTTTTDDGLDNDSRSSSRSTSFSTDGAAGSGRSSTATTQDPNGGNGGGGQDRSTTTEDYSWKHSTIDLNGSRGHGSGNGSTTTDGNDGKGRTTTDPYAHDGKGKTTSTPDGGGGIGGGKSKTTTLDADYHVKTTSDPRSGLGQESTTDTNDHGTGSDGSGSTIDTNWSNKTSTQSSTTTSSAVFNPPTTIYKIPDMPPKVDKNYTPSVVNDLIDKYGLCRNCSRVTLEAQVLERMQEVMMGLDPEVVQKLGYKLKDIVISCSYNGIPCDYEGDFTLTTDPDYGNCYTYNYKGKSIIERLGRLSGLRMIAFTNVSEYLPTSSKAGVRVTISKQQFAAFPDTEGYNVGIGTYAAMAVQYKKIDRLSKPYGDCHPANLDNTTLYVGNYYSTEACFRTCFQKQMIDACGCADGRFPLLPWNSSIQYCSPSKDMQKFLCYNDYIITRGDFDKVNACECTTGEPAYQVVVSSAVWPANVTNYTTPMCIDKYPGTDIDCYDAYSGNAAFIDVSYDILFYQYMYERPVMTPWDLFYQMSGQLSLWVSISMLALLEIFEVIYYCFISRGLFPPKQPKIGPASGFGDKPFDSISSTDGKFTPYSTETGGDYLSPLPLASAMSPDSYALALSYMDSGGADSYIRQRGSSNTASIVGSRFVSD